MKTTAAIEFLKAHPGRPAVFISDSANGDRIVISPRVPSHTIAEALRAGAETDVDTTDGLLLRLDFEVYEGEGPAVSFGR